MIKWCFCGFLVLHGILDAVTGYVYLPLIGLQLVTGIAAGGLPETGSGEILLRFLPGLLLFLLSLCSREQIGQGDAWLFLAAGPYLSLGQQLQLLFCASVLSVLWMSLKNRRKAVDKVKQLAFAPFVCAGYMGGWYAGWF